MRWTTVKEAKNNLSEILHYVEKDDVVITRNGKPTAIIHHVDEDDLMDYLVEHSPRFIRELEKSWEEYQEEGGITLRAYARKLKKRRD